MSVSTHGLRLKLNTRWLRDVVELLSAMRFAIALLTVICIASVIGTILKQQEPYSNYVNQFGPFWAEVFNKLSLFSVYSAWWFLLILLFLVISTSLCVARHTPQIIRDFKNFKLHLRVSSFQAFPHKATWVLPDSLETAVPFVSKELEALGWRTKTQVRADGVLIAAKTGSANKIGYLAAHSAIVLVCLGGLLDGDLLTRAQMWLGNKVAFTGGGLIADVPESSRLAVTNPAFRANLLVSEGQTAGTAILQQPQGVLLQDLPFSIELKKFVVEHYSTGMPKLFASDIVIHDRDTGEKVPARVEVNHPVNYKGINIFQSSFDDGGSRVQLESIPLDKGGKVLTLDGTIGSSTSITNGIEQLTLEYVALRVLNVETFSKKDLRNVGPSITYKLRDKAGQAREFHNYMQPITFPESTTPVYLLGVRDTPAESFRYWRIPSDDKGNMDGFIQWMQFVKGMTATNPAVKEAISRYLSRVTDAQNQGARDALQASSERVLELFAKDGLQGIADFLEKNVPEDQRAKTSDILIRILNGVLYELTPAHLRDRPDWLSQAVLAISDAKGYLAPMIFQLKDFTQVQASVFQVTRAPGQKIVYLGAILLIVGVFFMLFIRERRLWVWLQTSREDGASGVDVNVAYSTNRKMLKNEQEFEQIVKKIGYNRELGWASKVRPEP